MPDTKKLAIEVHIPLPLGLFEEAATIAKVQAATAAFKDALNDAVGDSYTFSITTVAPRKPRKLQSDISKPHKQSHDPSADAHAPDRTNT